MYKVGSKDESQTSYDANSSKYGDAVYETSANSSVSDGGWYGDYPGFPFEDRPFFQRGGHSGGGSITGLFCFNAYNGYGDSGQSFRPVLIVI